MTSFHKCNPGSGNINADVMIIGTSPAKGQTTPFTGRPGKILDECLKSVGLHRGEVYLTNVYCSYTDVSDRFNTTQPCLERLYSEINSVKPKLIIAVGDIACNHLLNKPLKEVRGVPIWKGNCYVLATYQLASVFFGGGNTIHDIVRDFQKIPLILSWPDDGSIGNVPYYIIDNHSNAQAILDELSGTVAIDIETTNPNMDNDALDVFIDRLICVGVGTPDRAYVFPANICNNLRWPTQNINYVFHNGIFDTQGMMKYLQVALPINDDTLLMSYILDERKGIHKLKRLAREYVGADFYEEGVPVGKSKLTSKEELQVYAYNAKDAVYTARLCDVLKTKLYEDNTYSVYKNLLIPAANAFSEIQSRGVYVDKKQILKLLLQWSPVQERLKEKLILDAQGLGFPGEINPNSTQQLAHLLYDILDLPLGPSTKKEILDELADIHPYVKTLLEYRKITKVLSTYILGVLDDVKTDSRVHAQVNLNGTQTGRLTYRLPPLQTIPKPRSDEDVEFLELRELFPATDDDYCIIETDYERIEVYVAAHISQDDNMMSDLLAGDFHRRVASTVFSTPFDKVTEVQRFNAKKVTFGIIYGATAPKLSQVIGSTPSEAQGIIEKWYSRYYKYFEWFDRTKKTLFREGEVQSPLGRKRRFKIFVGDYHKSINQAVNFPIQSFASDITLSSMTELHWALKPYDSYVLWLVHDSIVFEVNRKYLTPVQQIIAETMSKSRFEGMMGVPVEMKVGPKLSSVEKVKI